jgi:hypothetical protein
MGMVFNCRSCGIWTAGTNITGIGTAIVAGPGRKELKIYERTGTQSVKRPNQLAFTSLQSNKAAPKFTSPGDVWEEKTDVYSAYSLVPGTNPASDVSMTNGSQCDDQTSKRAMSGSQMDSEFEAKRRMV